DEVGAFERLDPPCARRGVPATEAGRVFGVHRADADALSLDVERGDVREADDPFRRLAKPVPANAMSDPPGAVSTSGRDHGADSVVHERRFEGGEARFVVAREKAAAIQDSGAHLHTVALR